MSTTTLLKSLWEHAGLPAGVRLVAVGGFGRGELFPHSDVDVLLLMPDGVAGPRPGAQARIEGFIGSCWDAGLEIGSSVRTSGRMRGQAAARRHGADLAARVAPAGGSRKLFADFQERFRSALDPRAFFVAKTLEMRQRHTKFENTPYSLEPNCKESPGGLRDLQVILWVAAPRASATAGTSWPRAAWPRLRGQQIKRNEGPAEPDPRAPAPGGQPARRPPGVRPADRRGRVLRLPTVASPDGRLLARSSER
jgi:[protein-PII] uridylyltransferase